MDFSQNGSVLKVADPHLISAYVQCRQVELGWLQTAFGAAPDNGMFWITMRYIGLMDSARSLSEPEQGQFGKAYALQFDARRASLEAVFAWATQNRATLSTTPITPVS